MSSAGELVAELDAKLAALRAQVETAREERERLEAAIAQARQLGITVTTDTLAALEALAEPEALADPRRLAELAAQLPPPDSIPADLFERDRQLLAISTLAAEGLSPAEIGARLSLPLGEVELLMSLSRRR